jgi:hypothetical protein
LPDDLDAGEFLGHQPELRHVFGTDFAGGLVARDRPVEAADEEVRLAVAVHVGDVGDVLPVAEERLAADGAQRVLRQLELRGARRAGVVVVAQVAVRLLGEEVHQPVAVEVHEAEPLPDGEVTVVAGAPCEVGGGAGGGGIFEEHDLPAFLLEKEVLRTVLVDVDNLRTRHVEAAQEGHVVGFADGSLDGPLHGEGRHAARVALVFVSVFALFRRRRGSTSGAAGGQEKEKNEDERVRG